MSVHGKGKKWAVRWREDGQNRSLSFPSKREAQEFDTSMKNARDEARRAATVREALDRARS